MRGRTCATVPAEKITPGSPSYRIVDSQSVKTNYEGETIGFHGSKKVKGRSRQVAVDTQGNIWSVHVHAVNTADTTGGCELVDKTLKKGNYSLIRTWFK